MEMTSPGGLDSKESAAKSQTWLSDTAQQAPSLCFLEDCYEQFTDIKQEMPLFDLTFVCPYLIPGSVPMTSLWEGHEQEIMLQKSK